MSNNIKSLFEFINKMKSLYVAPYHRGYNWDTEVCAKFLNKAFDSSEKTLDFGMITYQKCDDSGNFILIDGYQRLITILLFVQALIKTSKVKLALKNYPANFLVTNTTDEDVFKLKINNNDKNDIENIIKNKFDDVIFHNPHFVSNYEFFISKLSEQKTPILELLNNIAKIQIMNIVVNNETLDEEDIYFNMNQTFSQVDLIRNYVYKELKETKQIHIFNTYFLSMEKNLADLTNGFLIDYLTIQNNGLIPKANELYSVFVRFFDSMSKLKSQEDIIKHLYRYTSYYLKITRSDIKDEVLKRKLIKINSYEAKDTYPYLMEVFEDYDFAHINKHMLLDILDMIIMFVEQRHSDGETALTVNFASLSKDINRMLLLKDLTPKIITQEVEEYIEDEYIEEHRLTINDLMKTKAPV